MQAGKVFLGLILLLALTLTAPRVTGAESPPAYLFQWGSSGTADGQFNQPTGIAIDSTGNVYVTDLLNHRVQKFSADGTFLTKWGTNGTDDGQFNQPQGIAVDASGNVYVADSENKRIQKFSDAGIFLGKWDVPGIREGVFTKPLGVAVDGTGNVYVTVYHRVQKFTGAGALITSWGSISGSSSVDGEFSYPWGIAVDSTGNVLVVDSNNNRVQKFTNTGAFLSKWGSGGAGDGQFTSPQGIAVTGGGQAYVIDKSNFRAQKFDTAGTFLSAWGANGSGNGQFSLPHGIAVTAAGRVYVADRYNHRIQVFGPEPAPPSVSTGAPTGIGTTTATLNGNLSGLGTSASVTVRFAWGQTTSYGSYTDNQVLTATGTFSAELTGLTVGTTYHYRAVANGDTGGGGGADRTFTPGMAQTDSPGGITTSGATLNGTLVTLGGNASAESGFDWGLTTAYGTNHSTGSLSATGPFSLPVTGLSPGTTYHYRAWAAVPAFGYSRGEDRSFVTDTVPATVHTDNATNITMTGATINGTLIGLGGAASAQADFRWRVAGSANWNTTPQRLFSAPETLSEDLSGLTGGLTYEYYARVTTPAGVTNGSSVFFQTVAPIAPVVATETTHTPGITGATVNGYLTSLGNAASVQVWFEYHSALSHGLTTAPVTLTAAGPFQITLADLQPVTNYNYLAVAEGNGRAYGVERTLTTLGRPPVVTTQFAGPVYPTSAILRGTLDPVDSSQVDAWFDWKNLAAPGIHQTPWQRLTAPSNLSVTLSGLQGATTYYFRAHALGAWGEAIGAWESFTTGQEAPTVTTGSPTAITDFSAILQGTLVNPGSADALAAYLEISLANGAFLNRLGPLEIVGSHFSATVNGLSPATAFRFRAEVFGGQAGTGYGDWVNFRSDESSAAPAWADPREQLAFVSMRDGNAEIYRINADGTGLLRLTDNASTDTEPCWSPDGQWIAFSSNRLGKYEIFKMGADGASQYRLEGMAHNYHEYHSPAWSNDGRLACVAEDGIGFKYIAILNADTGFTLKTFGPPGGSSYEQPAWSPTAVTGMGRLALTGTGTSLLQGIYLWLEESDQVIPLTTGPDSDPAWSPDGTRIIFRRATATGSRLVSILVSDPAGSERLFTDHGGLDGKPSWSDNSALLAFHSDLQATDGSLDIWLMPGDESDSFNLTRGWGYSNAHSTWRTGHIPPYVETRPAEYIGPSSAILRANLLQRGSSKTVQAAFLFGPPGTPALIPGQSRNNGGDYTERVTGLAPDTDYRFQARVDGGANGIGLGAEIGFRTLPAYAPLGPGRIAYIDEVWEGSVKTGEAVFSCNPDGTAVTRLTPVASSYGNISWSGDHLIGDVGGADIFRVALDGQYELLGTALGRSPASDGQDLFFVDPVTNDRVWVSSGWNVPPALLYTNLGYIWSLAANPYQALAICAGTDPAVDPVGGGRHLYINFGQGPFRVDGEADATGPAYSADGRFLLYSAATDINYPDRRGLWQLDMVTGSRICLAPPPADAGNQLLNPTSSPDGRRVAWEFSDGTTRRLYFSTDDLTGDNVTPWARATELTALNPAGAVQPRDPAWRAGGFDNTAPVVSAGENRTKNAVFTQVATATDTGTMTYAWSKVSGPGTVTFGTANALATTITASVDGTYAIRFTATDSAGNLSFSDMTLVWDTLLPTVSTGSPSATVTKSGPVTYPLTYMGADAITLSDAGVTLIKTGTANGTFAVSGTGNATRTVTISGITGDGTLGISIAAGTASDAAGNTAASAGTSATFAVDNTEPLTTASPVAGIIGKGQTVTLTPSEAATIYYTLDGSTPDTNSAVYSGPIPLDSDATVQFFAQDSAGNTEASVRSAAYRIAWPGDVNFSGDLDIADAILTMQLLSGVTPSGPIHKETDVNGDSGLGLAEIIYILQNVAGIR